MTIKPTYEELENRIEDLERIVLDTEQYEKGLLSVMSEAEQLAGFGAWEWDMVRDVWMMSDNWLKIHGYKEKILNTEELLTIAHPKDKDRIQAAFNQCVNDGVPYEIEHRIIKHDTGEVRHIHAFGKVENNSSGKPVKLYGAAQDITLRKNTEDKLKESMERFSRLAENSQDMIYRMSLPDGVYEYVSPASETILGYTPEEFYASPFLIKKVIHPDWRGYLNEQLEKLIAGDMPPTYEYQVIHKSGETRWLNQRNVLIKDDVGKPIYIEGNVTDVTQFKEADDKLRESEEKFRTLVETSPLAMVMTSGIEQVIEYLNPAAISLFGYTHDEIPTTKEWWPLAYPDEDYRNHVTREWQKRVEQAIATNSESEPAVAVVTCKDGSTKDISWSFSAVGKQNWILGYDLTDQKKAEQERETIITQLQKKTEEQERFIYTVSHDLKAPLVTITGFCGLAEESLFSGNQEECKRSLDVVSNAAKRMRQLLDELLHISRIGIQQNPRETVSLEALVREAAESVSGEIAKHKTTIEVEPGLPDVKVDKQGFLQVIENLIANASKYSRSATDGSHVKVGINRNAEELVCYVKDNGIGIESQYLEKVFGLFERLDATSDSTGVGLAIVKRITENHGGRLWAESEGLGHGATFFFTLPEAKQ